MENIIDSQNSSITLKISQ